MRFRTAERDALAALQPAPRRALITETHPSALLEAMHIDEEPWSTVTGKFNLDGREPKTPDERDALLSAAVARNGHKHFWTVDLTDLPRGEGEMDPQHTFFGKVSYF
jgi:hypothetical protein